MCALEIIAERQRVERVLGDAISDQRQALVTHQTRTGWRIHKTTLVSGSEGAGLVTLRSRFGDGEAQGEAFLPNPGDEIGVTFRAGHKKCMFGSTVSSLAGEGTEPLITLQWPPRLQQLQRRAYQRIALPRHAAIPVRLVHGPSNDGLHAEIRSVRHAQLEDLSVGGMRVRIQDSASLKQDDAYRCVFAPRPGKPSFVIDALIRHTEAPTAGHATVGLQFIGLEVSAEGMRTLDRLARVVNYFQRARAKS